jgi:hypothetical protein
VHEITAELKVLGFVGVWAGPATDHPGQNASFLGDSEKLLGGGEGPNWISASRLHRAMCVTTGVNNAGLQRNLLFSGCSYTDINV